ncbi:hypothetical protein MRX96_024513 [Rhipicephalus microplus]
MPPSTSRRLPLPPLECKVGGEVTPVPACFGTPPESILPIPSILECLPCEDVTEVTPVPACFETPPEIILPIPSILEYLPCEDVTAMTLPANDAAPVDKSAQLRACKREPDMD